MLATSASMTDRGGSGLLIRLSEALRLARLAHHAVEAGAHRGGVAGAALDGADGEMHARHLLVIIHEDVVQAGAGHGADRRHELRAVLVRESEAEALGGLVHEVLDAELAERCARRPI